MRFIIYILMFSLSALAKNSNKMSADQKSCRQYQEQQLQQAEKNDPMVKGLLAKLGVRESNVVYQPKTDTCNVLTPYVNLQRHALIIDYHYDPKSIVLNCMVATPEAIDTAVSRMADAEGEDMRPVQLADDETCPPKKAVVQRGRAEVPEDSFGPNDPAKAINDNE